MTITVVSVQKRKLLQQGIDRQGQVSMSQG
jgi:hypothetical protein